jgi:pimeloyl-ACP methyl ester carboxylesterase
VNIRDVWTQVVDAAGGGDLKAPDCDGTTRTNCFSNVTVSNILGTARSLLEVPMRRRQLTTALLLAAAGNGSAFADRFLTGDVFTDSASYSIQNVQCQDGHFVAATSAEQVQGIARLTRTFTVTPGMGEFWNRVIGCTGYPVRVSNPRARLDVRGLKNPTLLVHARYDSATSMVYAQGMSEEIQGSVLLTRDGISHTNYFIQGETAMAVDAYLTNLTVPGPGTVLLG